jgi:hypothetical protein
MTQTPFEGEILQAFFVTCLEGSAGSLTPWALYFRIRIYRKWGTFGTAVTWITFAFTDLAPRALRFAKSCLTGNW